MVARVVRALAEAGVAERIRVVIDRPELLDPVAAVSDLREAGRLAVLPAAASPAASVASAFEAEGALEGGRRALVLTADHPLLTPGIVRHFASEAAATGASVAVGLVDEGRVRERFPESKRTFVPIRGMRFTGANMFAFHGAEAARAVRFWQRAEEHRKQPWRLAAAFGATTAALFLARRLDLGQTFTRASRIIGASIAPVLLPFAECAFDVDKPADLELVRQLIEGGRA